MKIRDKQICEKLLSEIRVADELLHGFEQDAFVKDERTARAVCMTLINIGELVKGLSEELRAEHREIPWRAIAGMRDVTAHKYQTLSKEDVYTTCTVDLPIFAKQLERLLKD